MIKFACPYCHSVVRIPRDRKDLYAWCKKCRRVAPIPQDGVSRNEPPPRRGDRDIGPPQEKPGDIEAPSSIVEGLDIEKRDAATDADADLSRLRASLKSALRYARFEATKAEQLQRVLEHERKTRAAVEERLSGSPDSAPQESTIEEGGATEEETSDNHAGQTPPSSNTLEKEQEERRNAEAAMIELLLRFSQRR